MKKVFEHRYEAERFAKEVKGLVKQSYLPNYNYVDVIYEVEYEEDEE